MNLAVLAPSPHRAADPNGMAVYNIDTDWQTVRCGRCGWAASVWWTAYVAFRYAPDGTCASHEVHPAP